MKKELWSRDTIISLVFGLIMVPLGVWPIVTYYADNHKNLTYTKLICSRILNVNANEIGNGIKLTYNNEEISNIAISIIKIQNTGSTPITSTDYESPIQFHFNTKNIISTEIIDNIKGIDVSINYNESTITLNKVLLNQEDEFKLKCTYVPENNLLDDFTYKTRIAGLKKVTFIDKTHR